MLRYLPITYCGISQVWLCLDLWTGRAVDLPLSSFALWGASKKEDHE